MMLNNAEHRVLARVFHAQVAADVRQHRFTCGRSAPTDVGGCTGLRGVLALLVLTIAVPGLLQAAASDLPSPEALLQRHIDALGGAEALRRAHSLHFRGLIDLPFVKAKAPIEFLFQEPDRFYCAFKYHHAFFGFLKVPFFARRQAECGYDGKSGWLVDFDSHVECLYGTDEAFFRGLLDKFSPLCFGRSFPLARNLGVERFADRDCYRLLVVLPFGEHAFEFYDLKSGLLAGTVYPFETDDAMVNIQTTYLDFRRVSGGLTLPFRLQCEVGDQRYTIQGSEIRLNEPRLRMPASKFKGAPPSVPLLKPASIPAREVIDRYATACGGGEALRSHTSLKLTGHYQMPGTHGFTNPVEICTAKPCRFSFTLPTPTGLYREGCDGEHYWRADGTNIAFAAPRDLAQKQAQLHFLADLHLPEALRSMDTLGIISVDKRDCYEVLLVRQDGEALTEFYDVQDGWLRGRHSTEERFGGVARLRAAFDDYRRFGHWSLATHQSYRLFGLPQVVSVANAEWDGVPDSAFVMPADVKAAWEKQLAAKGK